VVAVRKLLDGGVNPCCVDEKRRSPLHIAAASGNVSIGEFQSGLLHVIHRHIIHADFYVI